MYIYYTFTHMYARDDVYGTYRVLSLKDGYMYTYIYIYICIYMYIYRAREEMYMYL